MLIPEPAFTFNLDLGVISQAVEGSTTGAREAESHAGGVDDGIAFANRMVRPVQVATNRKEMGGRRVSTRAQPWIRMSWQPLLPRRRKDELVPGHRNCARVLRMFVHAAVIAVTAKFRRSTNIMSSRFSFGETASDSNGHGCIHIAADKIESVTIEGNENILNAGITVYDIVWKFLVWTVRWPVCISVFINGKRGP